jgi:transposase
MKSYSLDFRQKIIDTYQAEGISQRQVAKRFCVAYSFVTKLIKQFRDTQDLAPKPRSGRPRKLTAPQMEMVQDLVAAQPDSTLAELCTAVETQTQVNVSQTTMSRVMHRLHLTRKKKASALLPNQVNQSNSNALSSGKQ